MTTPYRADQVGSFLRPPALIEAHRDHTEGRVSLEELRKIEDGYILEVLKLQEDVGVDVVSDGEYRRGSWAGGVTDQLEGYVPGTPAVRMTFQGGAAGTQATPPGGGAGPGTGRVIGAKLRARGSLTGHEASFLIKHARKPFKITMPAPSYVVTRGYKPGVTDQAYASRADVLKDLADILNQEIKQLVEIGVPYVQLDNPHYPDYVVEERREQWRALGVDPDKSILEDIEADNGAMRGIDRSRVTLAMHLCRGNGGGGAWHSSGGYDRIAEQVFSGVEVDTWLLEYDTDRAGNFEPLRFMPRGKQVVLGLVTTKAGQLESQDELLRRIEEASKNVPLEDLSLSPQCGFASVIQGNPLTWDEQRRKLELVVDTARRVWG